MLDLRRQFGLSDVRGYRGALEERIKRAGYAPMTPDEVGSLCQAFRIKPGAAPALAADVVLPRAGKLSAADFESGKADDLKAFAQALGVEPVAVGTALRQSGEVALAYAIELAVGTGRVSESELESLRGFGRQLGLDRPTFERLYAAAVNPPIKEMFSAALASDSLSPADEARLMGAINDLRITPNFDATLTGQMAHARKGWQIANGVLPTVEVPLSLQRGEVAHAALSATAFQTATRTTSVSYGGPALRVRIAKGLYYRSGHLKVHRHTEQYPKVLGRGPLVVTNKRLVFIGANGSTSARLDSILQIEPFSDAVYVVRGSGKPTTYRFDAADEWFSAILARAIHDATEA
jgi:hypothetical protein